MADAYKVIKDVSLTRAIAYLGERVDGSKIYETSGINYPAGSYVLASNISPPERERVEDGELDEFLEEVSAEEAEAVLNLGELNTYYGTYIPEHEVESYYLTQYGHTVVPRDQVLELKSAGAEAAAEYMQEALDNEPDFEDNPLPKHSHEVPSLADVSRGDEDAVVPLDAEEVEVPAGLEQPPGLPVGETLAGAEGGADAAEAVAKKRGRPKKAAAAKKPEGTQGS